VDIANYERVRTNPRAPNAFGTQEPFPFILINLHEGVLQFLGFAVEHGACHPVPVERVVDDDPRVTAAWERAAALPYFRPEAKVAEHIRDRLAPAWSIRFGANADERTAVLAEHQDGRRVIMRFESSALLGLGHTLLDSRAVQIERYVDWPLLFSDLAVPQAALCESMVEAKKEPSIAAGAHVASTNGALVSPAKEPAPVTTERIMAAGQAKLPARRTTPAASANNRAKNQRARSGK
jgi:hypothetical protein